MILILKICITAVIEVNVMIVCHCAAVSDRDLHRAIDRGAGSFKELSRRTGAARCCGACRPEVESILACRTQAATCASATFESAVAA